MVCTQLPAICPCCIACHWRALLCICSMVVVHLTAVLGSKNMAERDRALHIDETWRPPYPPTVRWPLLPSACATRCLKA